MRCGDCKWKYPEAILSAMMVNGQYTKPICGICALERSNAPLQPSLRRKRFNGEMAESNRLSAIEWRRTHPNDAPARS